MTRLGRVTAHLRRNPQESTIRYAVASLAAGNTPTLRCTHGPDAPADTYDALCADMGFDPLAFADLARRAS